MSHVPVWVYVLFFVLLNIGIKRCNTRITTIERIAIIPTFFTLMSVYSINSIFGFTPTVLILWFAFVVVGSYIGYLHVSNRVIRADKTKRLIEIPGDMSMLILLMLIFSIEFFIHYAVEAKMYVAQLPEFKTISVILSGIIVGISAGRNVNYFIKYNQAISIELFETR